jgi:nicotinate-nucleotide pyrophosphorylase (carboxylating)
MRTDLELPPIDQWPAADLDRLTATGLDPENLRRVLSAAIAEDLRYGPDQTTAALIPSDSYSRGAINSRQSGVIAGALPVELLLTQAIDGVELEVLVADGGQVASGGTVLTVAAPTRPLLTLERTVLNLLSHLSAVATSTRVWVDAVAGTGCRIRDTRKTIPGLRELQKYAVRCGGGTNHRLGLGDAILIKDNHVARAGSIIAALAAVRRHQEATGASGAAELVVELEVDRLEQLDEALTVGVGLILLDNFTPAQCAEAVRRCAGSGVLLEASGGITLAAAAEYARTGVDYLAIGALTHSVRVLDLGLDL